MGCIGRQTALATLSSGMPADSGQNSRAPGVCASCSTLGYAPESLEVFDRKYDAWIHPAGAGRLRWEAAHSLVLLVTSATWRLDAGLVRKKRAAVTSARHSGIRTHLNELR